MKLVRDRYKEIISDERWVKVTDEEALEYAIEKIDEELLELKASNFYDIYEFADLIEIVKTVARLKGFSDKDLAKAIVSKNTEKGAFYENIILMDK